MSIDEFDLPDGSGAGGCTSRTKGFVLHVERCREHEHWISLTSEGTSEYRSVGNTGIAAGGDLTISAGNNRIEKIAENADVTAKKLRFHADVFVKKGLPPTAYAACLVTETVEEEVNGKTERRNVDMIDLNRLASWIGAWVTETEARIAALEKQR